MKTKNERVQLRMAAIAMVQSVKQFLLNAEYVDLINTASRVHPPEKVDCSVETISQEEYLKIKIFGGDGLRGSQLLRMREMQDLRDQIFSTPGVPMVVKVSFVDAWWYNDGPAGPAKPSDIEKAWEDVLKSLES